MFNFINKLILVFGYGDELNAVLKEKRKEEEDRIFRRDISRLKLCESHNPVQGLSNYAEHNCDYCKLLKKKDLSCE
jgi:hypothetical protein